VRTIFALISLCLAGCGPRLGHVEARQALEGFLSSQTPASGLADFELLSVQKAENDESLLVRFQASRVSAGNLCRRVAAEDVLRQRGIDLAELLAMRTFLNRFHAETSPNHTTIFKRYEDSPIRTMTVERGNQYFEPVVPVGGKAKMEGTMTLERGHQRWFVRSLGEVKETPDLRNLYSIPDGDERLLGPRGKTDANLSALVEATREVRPLMQTFLTRIAIWSRQCRDAVAEGRTYHGKIMVPFQSLNGSDPFEIEFDATLTVTVSGGEKLRNGNDFCGRIAYLDERLQRGTFYGNLLDKEGGGDRHEGGINLIIAMERNFTRGPAGHALNGYVRCVLDPEKSALTGVAIRQNGKKDVTTPIRFEAK